VRGALGNRCPYRDRTETDRSITNEPCLSRPIRKTTKKAEEKTLSSESRRRSALKKVFDTADIVRDVR
jgi:hypothetical protein